MSTDNPRFSWLKYQILKNFEDWLTTSEVRPGLYEKSAEKLKITAHAVIELPKKF